MTDASPGPQTVICTYRVKAGKESAFMDILARHWPALRGAGLATEERPLVYLGKDDAGPVVTEIFTWVDGVAGPAAAHQSPEVMAVWEPMGALCEERDGRPSMEFPHVTPVEINYA